MINKVELELLGLTHLLNDRVLDSDEKVQKLEDEQTRCVEKHFARWKVIRLHLCGGMNDKG